jgi:hypothetical protein
MAFLGQMSDAQAGSIDVVRPGLPAPTRAARAVPPAEAATESAGAARAVGQAARWAVAGVVRVHAVVSPTSVRSAQSGGKVLHLDPRDSDPSPFGHREGFVLENAQFAVQGGRGSPEKGGAVRWELRLELVPREKDGNRDNDFVRDAWVDLCLHPLARLRLGWQRTGLSQANLTPAAARVLPYQPTFDLFVPLRQLGATLELKLQNNAARLTIGAYNSVKSAIEQLRGWGQALASARLEVDLERLARGLQHAGVRWRVGLNGAWTPEHFDPQTEHRWAGIDTHVRWGRLDLRAEALLLDFMAGDVLDTGVRPAMRGWGWHVDLGWQLLRDRLLLVGRLEESDGDDLVRGYSPSLSVQDRALAHKRWLSGTLAWQQGRYLRWSLTYIHRGELEGFELDNDVVLATLSASF